MHERVRGDALGGLGDDRPPRGFMYCCSLQEAAAVLEEISSLGLAAPAGLVQVTQVP